MGIPQSGQKNALSNNLTYNLREQCTYTNSIQNSLHIPNKQQQHLWTFLFKRKLLSNLVLIHTDTQENKTIYCTLKCVCRMYSLHPAHL